LPIAALRIGTTKVVLKAFVDVNTYSLLRVKSIPIVAIASVGTRRVVNARSFAADTWIDSTFIDVGATFNRSRIAIISIKALATKSPGFVDAPTVGTTVVVIVRVTLICVDALNSGKTIVALYALALILNTFRVFATSIFGLVAKTFTIVATTGDFIIVIAIFVVANLVTNSTTRSRHISVSKV